MALNEDGTKTCPRCGEAKLPNGNFYRTGRPSGDGYAGYCIPCARTAALGWFRNMPEDRRRAKNAADAARTKRPGFWTPERRRKRTESTRRWIKAHPEKQREWQRAHKRRNPELARQRNAVSNNRSRAKRLGLPNSFQWLDWVRVLAAFEESCAFCGARGCLLDLEHLVPMVRGGPNAVGNVVPACRPCNAQKQHRSLDDFAVLRGISSEQLEGIRRRANVVDD